MKSLYLPAFALLICAVTALAAPALEMRRVKELAAMLPEKPRPVLLAPITNRAAWGALPEATAKQLLATAERQLAAGLLPFSEEAYLEFTRSGKRLSDGIFIKRNAYLRDVLFGECVENTGRFLPAIEAAVQGICAEKT